MLGPQKMELLGSMRCGLVEGRVSLGVLRFQKSKPFPVITLSLKMEALSYHSSTMPAALTLHAMQLINSSPLKLRAQN